MMLEHYVPGTDIVVCVLGTDKTLRTLPPVQIIVDTGMVTAQQKYDATSRELVVPADLSPSVANHVSQVALYAHQRLHCRGWSKVDFRVNSHAAYVIEVDSVPGMASTSMMPAAARAAGIPYEALVIEVLDSAFSR
jgi:D-alanine-D-alanine ligase